MDEVTDTAYRRLIAALETHVSKVRENGVRAEAQCPAHDDTNPSLSITHITGSVLVYCHAGCSTDDVLAALNLTTRDLYDNPKGATYTYDDGRMVHRTPDKRFWQTGTTNGTRAELYRRTQVDKAVINESFIYVVEGEKDVLAVEAAGGVATCAPMGAGNWSKVDAEPLYGGKVIVVADKDTAGYAHARDVMASLSGMVPSIRVVVARTGKDAADHIAAGHTLQEFDPIDLEAADTATGTDADGDHLHRLVPGGTFILDSNPDPEPVWGIGKQVLMAEGEALLIVADQGLGKTTLGQQFALGRSGIPEYATLLGFPIKPGTRRTLYLAMDRPRQAARSFRRMVGEAWRAELDDRLVVWPGPPPHDMAKHTGLLLDLCVKADADTVVLDSVKDAAIGLSDDEVGSAYNRARQTAIREDIEVLELHHPRKAQQGVKRTPSLDDSYGSTWLTTGAGSVLLLTGKPGDPIVGLLHLKQPSDEVGPLRIIHDQDTGRTDVFQAPDLASLARTPISAVDAAKALFETDNPTRNEKEKARRRLDHAVHDGLLTVARKGDKATNTPTLWVTR